MGTITTGIELAAKRARIERGEGAETADSDAAQEKAVDPLELMPMKSPRRVRLDSDLLARNRVMNREAPQAARAAYKMLRTRVLRRMHANRWETLAVTSLNKSEGKTLTAINLALSIASQPDKSVILVDLDLRNPTVYKYLGLDPKPGIDSWFDGSAELGELLVCPELDRLLVIPNSVTFDESSERLQSQAMADLIAQLKMAYPSSLLLFDLPPLLEADDAIAFAPHVDATLLVVSQGQTDRNRLPRAQELLEETNLLGVVLNKSDEASASYY